MDAPCCPVVLCDVSRMPADAATVDVLARLLLSLRRRGYALQLCNASPQLCELIDFIGLGSELPASVETRR